MISRTVIQTIAFQSTPPARGATKSKDHQDNRYKISIHAPREGGDGNSDSSESQEHRFQSTPPARGATDIITSSDLDIIQFQSTPPARGATNA